MSEHLRQFKVAAANKIPVFMNNRWLQLSLVAIVALCIGYNVNSFTAVGNKIGQASLSNSSVMNLNNDALSALNQNAKDGNASNVSKPGSLPGSNTDSPNLTPPAETKVVKPEQVDSLITKMQLQDQQIADLISRVQATEDKISALKSAAPSAAKTTSRTNVGNTGLNSNKFDINRLAVVSINDRFMTILMDGQNKVIKPGQIIAGDVFFLAYDPQSKQLKTTAGNFFVEQ
jgi:hypothetical protein